jgi:spermidine synthase
VRVQRRVLAGNADDGDAVTMIVVGAGACVLPSWLVSVSPRCRVSAVEYSSEVIEAAWQCFGLNSVPRSQLEVLVEEGASFVARCAPHSYDAVFVTAGGLGDAAADDAGAMSESSEQLAPPAAMAARDFVAAVQRALRPGGLYAVNVLCRTEAAGRLLVRRIQQTMVDAGFCPAGIHVAISGQPPTRNFLLFASSPPPEAAAPSDAARPVDTDELLARYAALCGTRHSHSRDSALPEWLPWETFCANS